MKSLKSILVLGLVLTSCERPADNQAEIRALRHEIERLKAQQEANAQPLPLQPSPTSPPPIAALPPPPHEAAITISPVPPKENTKSKAKRLAPDGVFYTIQRVTLSIEGGVKGLPPGTAVNRISQDANGVTIQTSEGLKGVIPSYNLTNDLDIAEEIAATYAKEQQESALARAKATEQLAIQERQRKEEAARKQQPPENVPYTPPYIPSSRMQRIGGGG